MNNLQIAERIDELADRFEAAWIAGREPAIESFLDPDLSGQRMTLLAELIRIDAAYRVKRGASAKLDDYLAAFPELRQHVEVARELKGHFRGLGARDTGVDATERTSPNECRNDDKSVPFPTTIGPFTLLEELGSGSFGKVFRAHDEQLDRSVAVKVLRAAAIDSEERQRFLREARSVAQLRHESIVVVHEAGEHDRIPYVVSEFIAGRTLQAAMQERRFEFRRSAELAAAIARALDHAHRHGVVHRDVKPSNILLDEAGRPHVADFGLAKQAAAGTTMTVEGQVLGTPAYMSPEQAAGRADQADARTDVYSLGVVLYEMLTANRPFRGELRMLLAQVQSEEPRPPRRLDDRIPRDLETICLKAMAKEPARRYVSAAAFADDLDRYLRGEPIVARPVGSLERTAKWVKRHPTAAALLAVLGLLAATFLVSEIRFRHEQQTRLDEQRQKTEAEQRASQELAQRLAAQQERAAAFEALLRAREDEYGQRIALADRHRSSKNVLQALEILDKCRPQEGSPDLRHWEWNYLQRQLAVRILDCTTAARSIELAGFTTDAKQIITAGIGWDGSDEIEVWDANTGQRLAGLKGRRAVAFSPDGRRFAARENDNTVAIRDLSTGEELLSLRGHPSAIECVAFSADGTRIASASSLMKLQSLPGRFPSVQTVWVTQIKLWDAVSGRELLTFQGHINRVLAIAFSPDGQTLASADGSTSQFDAALGRDELFAEKKPGVVKLWLAANGEEVRTLGGFKDSIRNLAFSADGKRLAAADEHGVKVWDVSSGREQLTLLDGSAPAALSPDGNFVAALGPERSVRVWDLAGREAFVLRGPEVSGIRPLAFNPDGGQLLLVQAGRFELWDIHAGSEPARTLAASAGEVVAACFWSDRKLMSADDQGTVTIWDSATLQKLRSFRAGEAIGQAASSADGQYLATANADKTVRVWQTNTGNELHALRGHADRVNGVAISPDAAFLASASADQTVKVWDLATGDERLTLHTRTGPVETVTNVRETFQAGERFIEMEREVIAEGVSNPALAVAFSPDGKRLAAVCRDWLVKIWDAATGEELAPRHDPSVFDFWKATEEDINAMLHRGRGARWQVGCIVFSPDGQRLATAAGTDTIRIWDAAAGQETLSLTGHTAAVYGLAFSSDGMRLASASADRTIKIWDAASGRELLSLGGHEGAVYHLAFTRDGHQLVSASADGTVKIWDATPSYPLSTRSRVLLHNKHATRRLAAVPSECPRLARVDRYASRYSKHLWTAWASLGKTGCHRCHPFHRSGVCETQRSATDSISISGQRPTGTRMVF